MQGLTVIENGLIPIYENAGGDKLVNARELHAWLKVGRDFSTWLKDRIEKYDFVENMDYIIFTNSGENAGRPTIEYIFKLSPAKEIAMVENNPKGKEVRKYFIAVEDKHKKTAIDISKLTPELQMFKQIFDSVASQQLEVKQLKGTIETIKDTIITQPDNWREDINRMFNKIALTIGENKFRDLRGESYKLLEDRAHVDLKRRLIFYQARLAEQGMSKTAVNKTNRLDVIEQDPKLMEIYAKIIQEYTIRFVA